MQHNISGLAALRMVFALIACLAVVLLVPGCGGGGDSGTASSGPTGSSGGGGSGGGGGGTGGGGGSSVTNITNAKSFSGANIDMPDAIAIDGNGDVWVANWNGTGVTEITPASAAQDCSAGCFSFGAAQNVPLSNYLDIAVDQAGNVWLPQSAGVAEITSGGTEVNCYAPSGSDVGGNYVAIDNGGDIWVSGGFTSYSVGTYANTCALVSPSPGYPFTNQPMKIAVDHAGNVWVTTLGSSNTGDVVELPAATPSSAVAYTGGGILSPQAVAIDNSGNVWVLNANSPNGTGSSTVTEIAVGAATDCSSGCVNYTVSGLNHAEGGIAVDGNDDVWVAGGVGADIVEIKPGAAADCSSGCTTYTSSLLSQPESVAIDGSGNVWIADEGMSTVAEFPALAGATVTPIAAQTR